MLKEQLAKNLREQRRRNNWTQETAAELCDLSARFWGKIEQCKTSCSIETLEKIAVGLSVNIGTLLNDPDAPEEKEKAYRLVISPDGRQNGVQVGDVMIPNITPYTWEAKQLLDKMQRGNISEVHVLDVVLDWIAEREPMG